MTTTAVRGFWKVKFFKQLIETSAKSLRWRGRKRRYREISKLFEE